MKWLTIEYIEEQAKISDEAALDCCILHHQQIHDATVYGLKQARAKGLVGIGTYYCSLCIRYGKFGPFGGVLSCGKCPLAAAGASCINGGPHKEAAELFRRWESGKASHSDFLAAHEKLLNKLKSLRKEKIMKCGILSDVYKDGEICKRDVRVTADFVDGRQKYFRVISSGKAGYVFDDRYWCEEGYSYCPVEVEVVAINWTSAEKYNVIYEDDDWIVTKCLANGSYSKWMKPEYSYRRIEKAETTEVLGKKYKKEDVEKRLAELTPIE